jgi:hypothetical protein
MLEKKHDVGLSIVENWKLKKHVKMCGACKNYANLTDIIEEAIKKHNTKGNLSKMDTKALKKRIIYALEKAE